MTESRQVLKYPLPPNAGPDVAPLRMAQGSKIVDVGHQDGVPYIWVLSWIGAPAEDRAFGVFLTGQDVPLGWEHVGTIHIHRPSQSPEVLHVFEATR